MARIGVGIITCNRESFFNNCYNSIPSYVDDIVIVNDGKPLLSHVHKGVVINNPTNIQVGQCKNIAMRYLLDGGSDYIFTLEDDIILKDPDILHKYISTHLETGIHHFNFGFSQRENLTSDLQPVYRKVIEYRNSKIVLTPNILGALTFYTRTCLQTIGMHHHAFNKGHGDHPELTYRAYKHGFTTPFWWFADIYDSWNMIENQSNMGTDSVVRNQDNMLTNFKEACDIFKTLHGVSMLEVPDVGETCVVNVLKSLKNKK